VLIEQIRQYLVAHGHGSRVTATITGEYLAVQLTADGELAKRDFTGTVVTERRYSCDGAASEKKEPGVDYNLFSLVAGGADGQGGIKGEGVVHIEMDLEPPTPSTSPNFESDGREHPSAVALFFAGKNPEYFKQVDIALREHLKEEVFFDERFAHVFGPPRFGDLPAGCLSRQLGSDRGLPLRALRTEGLVQNGMASRSRHRQEAPE